MSCLVGARLVDSWFAVHSINPVELSLVYLLTQLNNTFGMTLFDDSLGIIHHAEQRYFVMNSGPRTLMTLDIAHRALIL